MGRDSSRGATSDQPDAHLKLLLAVTNLLVSRPELADLFRALSGCLGEAVRHAYASISLNQTGQDGALVRLVVLDGARRADLEGRTLVVSAGSQASFEHDEPVLFELDHLRLNNPDVASALAPLGLRSFCSVPLRSARRVLGIMSVASREAYAFGDEDKNLLQQVSGQIAIAIENAIAFEEIRSLRDQLATEKRYLEDEIRTGQGFDTTVVESVAMRHVMDQVQTVARTDSTVLITGETGTGKELVARAIHSASRRRDRTFVRVNCAAIPPALVESELFGHERGAFTGAVSTRLGRFEIAHRATLFLDEIGELTPEMQPKLLRALQEREIERLGSARVIPVDVRVVAATNRGLHAMVADGRFRADLFFRLSVFPIHIPPLRERPEDIPPLVRYFLHKHASRLKRLVSRVPSEAMAALTRWTWPGNVRELENVIERAVILSRGPDLEVIMPAGIDRAASRTVVPRGLADAERTAILDALRTSNGVLGGPAGAAARLGVKRTTLQSKMRKLGIRRPSY